MALALAETLRAEIHHIPSQQCNVANVEDVIRQCWYVPASGGLHLVLVDEADKMSVRPNFTSCPNLMRPLFLRKQFASHFPELRHRWNDACKCYQKAKELGLNVAEPYPPSSCSEPKS